MTVGELREALAKLDSRLNVVTAFDGAITQILEVAEFDGDDFVLLRGRRTIPENKKFTTHEQGFIGHLVRLGFNDDKIGEVLGRPAKGVQQTRKKLGF